MKRKILGVFLIIGLILAVLFIINFFSPSLPTKVKSDNILKIVPGMPVENVFNILGRPFSITALYGIHQIGCVNPNPNLNEILNKNTDIKKLVHDFISNQKYCCDGNKRDLEEFDNITLVYTKRGILFSYPMLWVHLDTSFRVNNVYAKEYEGWLLGDDPGIYSFGWAMDSTYTKWDYTKTCKSMNKEKFYRCFK
jgi:hypothetical protein